MNCTRVTHLAHSVDATHFLFAVSHSLAQQWIFFFNSPPSRGITAPDRIDMLQTPTGTSKSSKKYIKNRIRRFTLVKHVKKILTSYVNKWIFGELSKSRGERLNSIKRAIPTWIWAEKFGKKFTEKVHTRRMRRWNSAVMCTKLNLRSTFKNVRWAVKLETTQLLFKYRLYKFFKIDWKGSHAENTWTKFRRRMYNIKFMVNFEKR